MECPICFESVLITDIHTTSCNHHLCKTCVHKLSKQYDNQHHHHHHHHNHNNYCYQCPICRHVCISKEKDNDINDDDNNMNIRVIQSSSLGELYEIYVHAITSDEAQGLCVTRDLYNIIGFVLTNTRDKRLLHYLLQESQDKEFQFLYNDCIVKRKPYFVHIKDPIYSFSLALLHYKYH